MAYPANLAVTNWGSLQSGNTADIDTNFRNVVTALNGIGNGTSTLSTVAITTATITNANVTAALITTANVVTMSSSNVVITGGTAILSTSNITTLGAATINFGDGTQQTTAATVTAATIQPGFVNRIRNASLSAQQYGTSGAVSAGTPRFTADGWVVGSSGANVTWQILTGAAAGVSSPSVLRITGANGVTDTFVRFPLVGEDSSTLSGKIVTFQMQVDGTAGVNVTPTLTVKHPSALDNWANVAVDINSANLQVITSGGGAGVTLAYAFTANSSVTNGMEVIVDFAGALSNSSNLINVWSPDMRVTPGVALGQVATPQPAEIRNATSDIAWCQRFFRTNYDNGVAPGTVTTAGQYNFLIPESGNLSFFGMQFPITMRADPTVTLYSPSTGASGKIFQITASDVAASATNIGQNGFCFSLTATANGLYGAFYAADVTIIGG